jgi:pSer/pThr/pTyr-binding forkhead associated (FHA) protein
MNLASKDGDGHPMTSPQLAGNNREEIQMASTVVVEVKGGGPFEGRFVFSQPARCTVGRSDDCDVRIPDGVFFHDISRRHCVLRIIPPDVRICDMGSRNGTFVNETKIGQRKSADTPESGGTAPFPEWIVRDGDEIRIGHVVLGVQVCPESVPEGADIGACI